MALPKCFQMRGPSDVTIEVPSVGYGTMTETPATLPETIAEAIKLGVRHLDCAWEYGVNKEVSEGIRLSGIPRSEIFITHKIHMHFMDPKNVSLCADQNLNQMGIDYVDLMLIHTPVAVKPLPDLEHANCYVGSSIEERRIAVTEDNQWIVDAAHSTKDIAAANGQEGSILPTWEAMKQLVCSGKARAVGVSNFSIDQLNEILDDATTANDDIPISANQVEVHPYAPNRKLLQFMKDKDILAMGHSPFATFKWLFDASLVDWVTEPLIPPSQTTTLLNNPEIKGIAERNGMGVGQVLHSWAVQTGVIPLGRSSKSSRIKENLDVRRLSDEDMAKIASLEAPGLTGKGQDLALCFPPIKFPPMQP